MISSERGFAALPADLTPTSSGDGPKQIIQELGGTPGANFGDPQFFFPPSGACSQQMAAVLKRWVPVSAQVLVVPSLCSEGALGHPSTLLLPAPTSSTSWGAASSLSLFSGRTDVLGILSHGWAQVGVLQLVSASCSFALSFLPLPGGVQTAQDPTWCI